MRQCLASTSLKVSCSLSVFFDMDFLFLLLSRLPIMEVLLVFVLDLLVYEAGDLTVLDFDLTYKSFYFCWLQ